MQKARAPRHFSERCLHVFRDNERLAFFFLNVRQAGRCRDGKKDLFSSRKNFHSDLSLDETTR